MTTKFNDAWGFSKLDVYRTCPRKFKYQFIDKLPQPDSPAMARGSKIHEGLEMFLNGWGSIPEEAKKWEEPLTALKLHPNVKGEQALGFNKDWTLRKDWYGPECWLRVKMDAYYFDAKEFVAIDYKTGKYRVPSTDQVELYGCAGIELAPHVQTARVEMWFIDTEETYSKEYSKQELLHLRAKFEKAVAPLYAEVQWKPNPSRECRWCPYSKTKGGPCQF